MIETVRRISRNVKRWQSGDMCLRWTAAGMLEAERQFRRVIGHGDVAKLAVAVERDITATQASTIPTEPHHAPTTTAAPQVAASPA
jgi:putative transposase